MHVHLSSLVHQSDPVRFHVEELPFVIHRSTLLPLFPRPSLSRERESTQPTHDRQSSRHSLVLSPERYFPAYIRSFAHIATVADDDGRGTGDLIVLVTTHIGTIAAVHAEQRSKALERGHYQRPRTERIVPAAQAERAFADHLVSLARAVNDSCRYSRLIAGNKTRERREPSVYRTVTNVLHHAWSYLQAMIIDAFQTHRSKRERQITAWFSSVGESG